MNQAPNFNFEYDANQLLEKALELGFVSKVAEDQYLMNDEYGNQKCSACGTVIEVGEGCYAVDGRNWIYCGHNKDCLLSQSDKHGVTEDTLDDDEDACYAYYTTL